MYQQTRVEEKPYTKADIEGLRRAFKQLEKARYSESVKAYTKKLRKELKP